MAENFTIQGKLEVDDSQKVKISEIGQSLDQAATTSEGAWSRLGSYLKDHFVITLGDIINVTKTIFGSAVGAIKDWISAASEGEAAEARLAAALKTTGQYTDATFKSMKAYADQLQETTIYDNDAILGVQGLLAQFKLSPEAINAATKSTLDLASGLKIDLNSAAMMVTKATQGHIETFNRYGITMDEARVKTEGVSYVLGIINGQFGGKAAADVATFAGHIAQLKNAWNDFEKALGNVIIKNPQVLDALDRIRKALANPETINQAVHGFNVIVSTLELIGKIAGGIAGAFSAAGAAFNAMIAMDLLALGKLVSGLEKLIPGNQQLMKDFAAETKNAGDIFLSSSKANLEFTQKMWGLGAATEDTTKKQSALEKAADAARQALIKEGIAAETSAKALIDAYALLGVKSDEAIKKEALAAKAAYDQIEAAYQQGMATEDDFAKAHNALSQSLIDLAKESKTNLQELGIDIRDIDPKLIALASTAKTSFGSVGTDATAAANAVYSIGTAADQAGQALTRLQANQASSAARGAPKGEVSTMDAATYYAYMVSIGATSPTQGVVTPGFKRPTTTPYKSNSIDGYSKS